MRVLALDIGTVRIGVALSDELGLTAQPPGSLAADDPEAAVREVRRLCREHGVGRIVVGLPRTLDGREGPAAAAARRWIERLERAVGVPVIAWDERLTTAAAERALIAADVSRRRRRRVVDQMAAALILQSYLDSRRRERGEAPR